MAGEIAEILKPRQKSASASERTLKKPPTDSFSADSDSERLIDSIERVSTLLESLYTPLAAYLETMTPAHRDVYSAGAVSQMLAESPIAVFLKDDSVTDIFINGPDEVFINRSGTLEKTPARFPDAQSLHRLANAIAGSVGRTLDARRPLADARLKDGSRVNIIAPPMAVDGLTLSIRKFPKHELTLEALIEKGEMSEQMAEFLRLCASCRVSLLVSGGTGTGKTTLLNAISRYIPENERIITIEDTAELRLQQPHVIRLEIKEPSVIGERKEEVNASDLVRNALRMRPDRIIVGEVRGEEAYDMIQALNTGHEGSMTTVHANTPRDAFTRLENLMSQRMQNTDAVSIRRQIVSALNIVVQLVYHSDGTRIVSHISEIVGMEGDIFTMQDIFTLHENVEAKPGTPRFTQHWTKILPHHPGLSEAMRASALFSSDMNNMARASF